MLNMVTNFGLEQAKDARKTMSSSEKLSLDKDGVSINNSTYRSIIGNLLYLIARCLDIC